MKITVSTVKGSWPAQFGKTRVSFTSKDYEDGRTSISGFFLTVPNEGDELEGNVVKKGEYTNFEFPKKGFSPLSSPGYVPPVGDLNRVEKKVDLVIEQNRVLKPILDDILTAIKDTLASVKKEELGF